MAYANLPLPDLIAAHEAAVLTRDHKIARPREVRLADELIARLIAENERLACQYRGAMLVIGKLVEEADRELELERFAVGA